MIDAKSHTKERYLQLAHWLDGSLGKALLASEAKYLVPIWEMILGDYLIVLGHPILKFLTHISLVKHTIFLFPNKIQDQNDLLIQTKYESLPISPASINAILLAHALEFSSEPQQILREVETVLAPEGYLILMAFNPWSLFGIRHFFSLKRKIPWCGKFHSAWRIKDWVQLLNFEILECKKVFYLPPIKNGKIRSLFKIWEVLAKICLPIGGGAYIILAKKKRFGGVIQTARWRTLSEVVQNGLVKPATGGVRREQNS